jgi:site-specific DNA-adenine methylase
VNSPIGWPGGKRRLVKRLLSLLPEHRTYVEPFCGSAKLLFAKDPSQTEVISDANGDLINFFLVTKYRPSALAEQCDPPYVDYCSNGRYEAFDGDKLAFLFNLLAKIKGKFIMSEENHPDVKKHVASHGMQCRSVLTTYSLSKSSNAQVKAELLISNFPLRSLAAAKS